MSSRNAIMMFKPPLEKSPKAACHMAMLLFQAAVKGDGVSQIVLISVAL